MPGADSYPEGTEALATDSPQRSLVKIVSLLNDGAGGGGGAAQTPWAQNINGGGFNLANVGNLAATNLSGALTGNVTGDVVGDVTGNVTGVASGNVASVNGTAEGLTITSLSDGDVLQMFGEGDSEASLFVVSEAFGAGNFQANIGSLGIQVGDGAYMKFGAGLEDWAPILTGRSGASSPEGVITAPAGTHYWQINVGEWVKNSGSGNTGWVQHTFIEGVEP